jgi:hypothetical protein
VPIDVDMPSPSDSEYLVGNLPFGAVGDVDNELNL